MNLQPREFAGLEMFLFEQRQHRRHRFFGAGQRRITPRMIEVQDHRATQMARALFLNSSSPCA